LRRTVLLTALLTACTYDNTIDPRPDSGGHPFQLVRSAPQPGEPGWPRQRPVDLFFNEAPAPESLAEVDLRVFSGLIETPGQVSVDLLERRLRFIPIRPFVSAVRQQVYLSENVRGLSGTKLAHSLFFDFETSTDGGGQLAARPPVSAAALQSTWSSRCAGCHGAAAAPAGVDLSTVSGALATLKDVPSSSSSLRRVLPGDHSKSYLLRKLLQQGGMRGLPMPPDGGPLSAEELRRVADWVDSGALP